MELIGGKFLVVDNSFFAAFLFFSHLRDFLHLVFVFLLDASLFYLLLFSIF